MPNIPIALIEAKDNSHSVGGGMQQALAGSFPKVLCFVERPTGHDSCMTLIKVNVTRARWNDFASMPTGA